GRAAARVGLLQLLIPVVFVAGLEFVQIQEVAVGGVVDAEVAQAEAGDAVGQVFGRIDGRERIADGGFHHLHAGAVVRAPVGVVGHLLDIGASRAGAIGAGVALDTAAGIGVAVDAGSDRVAQVLAG